MYVTDPESKDDLAAQAHKGAILALPDGDRGPAGEAYCWYACTVKGGRETSDLDVVQLSVAVEALGAGELLVNCVDKDGQKSGFAIGLLAQICGAVSIPVIASSGAGCPAHFDEVFTKTSCQAALAAGIFHRNEVSIDSVKAHLADVGKVVRRGQAVAAAGEAKSE